MTVLVHHHHHHRPIWMTQKRLEGLFITTRKNVYCNERNQSNNIKVIAIVDTVIQGVAIKFEVIGLCNKNSVAINSKYLNDNLLFRISYKYRLLLHEFYCNRLQIIDQNKSN